MKIKNIYLYSTITILLCFCSNSINTTAGSDLGNTIYSDLNASISLSSDNDLNIPTDNLKEIPFLDMSEFPEEKKKYPTENTDSDKNKSTLIKRQRQDLQTRNTIKEDSLTEKEDTVQVLNSQNEDANIEAIMVTSSFIKTEENKNLNSIKHPQKNIDLNKIDTRINKNKNILVFCIFSIIFILFVQFLIRGIR